MNGQGIGDEYGIGGKGDECYLDGQKRGSGREKRWRDEKREWGRGYYHYCCVLTPGKNHCQEQGELRGQPKLLQLV